MRTELKLWMIQCDRCRKSEPPITSIGVPKLPEGWITKAVYGCGMTGYTRYDELCPECVKKEADHE